MLQSKLFSGLGILAAWPPAGAMLLNNLIASSTLSLVGMPFVARRLRFWLQPAYRLSSKKDDFLGMMIVATSLGMMLFLFHRF
jgi:antibiotic biosynthesis monooxygenase (ABM) superfamily enzyme